MTGKIKMLALAAAIASTAVISGCATSIPISLIYTKVTLPVSGSGEMKCGKVGEAACKTYFTLFAAGDASVQEAARNGNITNIKFINYRASNFFGIYGSYTTIVYGD